MKVLVTGGLGFIGSNITGRLVRDGHEVTALDNLHTGSEANVAGERGKLKMIKGNAGSIAGMAEKFDVIFHEGISSSSPMYKENPHLVATAIDEMISILEYAKRNGTRVVFAATSSVYNQQKPPHREDMPVNVVDYYTEARYEMERLAELYGKLYGVKVAGLRYFSVYGPHEKAKGKYANLITQFLWAIENGEKVIIYGDGKQTRDFVYVDDVVEANMLAMKFLAAGPGFGIFNVGTGRSIAINDMVQMVGRKLGKEPKIEHIENRIKNYVEHTLADTTLAEKKLGFKARITLEKGIEMLVDYYRKNPKEMP